MNPALRRSKLPPPLGKGHKRLPGVEGPQAHQAHAVSRGMGMVEGHGRASDRAEGREHEQLPLSQAPEEPVHRRASQLGSGPCGEDLARHEEEPQSARGRWQEQRPSSTQAAPRHAPRGHDRSSSNEQQLGNGQPAWRGGRDQRQQGPSPPQGAPPRETHNR